MSALHQVRILLTLRWQMLRTVRARLAVVGGIGVAVGLLIGVATLATTLSREYADPAAQVLPILLLTFVVLSVVGGLAAGGGTEIVPAAHLVAYPVTPRAVYLGSVALAPLNFAWSAQMVMLLGLVLYLTTSPGVGAVALLLLIAFALAATTSGLALSWWLVGVRQNRIGRRVTTALGIAAGVAVVTMALTGSIGMLLDIPVFDGLATTMQRPTPLSVTAWMVALAAASVVAFRLGVRACAWSLRRRDEPSTAHEARPHVRRAPKSSPLRQTLAVDRGSIWRSRPIRRGLLLMGLAPGIAAAVSAPSWSDLVILPPLVAAGAALLFAINVVSLDGPGALWLESTPRSPAVALTSKAWATAEVVLTTVLMTMAVVTARLGAPQQPRLVLTLALSVLVGVVWAVALALRRSIRKPHKADLRSARDTPGPPTAMLAHAVRLTLFAIIPGTGFTLLLVAGPLWLLPAFAGVMVALAALHMRRTWREWGSPTRRSLVVARVALG